MVGLVVTLESKFLPHATTNTFQQSRFPPLCGSTSSLTPPPTVTRTNASIHAVDERKMMKTILRWHSVSFFWWLVLTLLVTKSPSRSGVQAFLPPTLQRPLAVGGWWGAAPSQTTSSPTIPVAAPASSSILDTVSISSSGSSGLMDILKSSQVRSAGFITGQLVSLTRRDRKPIDGNSSSEGSRTTPVVRNSTFSMEMTSIRSDALADTDSTTRSEVLLVSATGILISLGILCVLGLGSLEPSEITPDPELVQTLAENVVDAAIPLTAPDAVSVTLGEVVGATIATCTSACLSFVFSNLKKFHKDQRQSVPTVSDAIADGDYFMTRAAAMPLLGSIGTMASPDILSLTSILVATIPSTLARLQSKKRQQVREDENEALQHMLEDRKRKNYGQSPVFVSSFQRLSLILPQGGRRKVVDVDKLQPVETEDDLAPNHSAGPDWVDLFGDVSKWLLYDALCNNFGGSLGKLNIPLLPGEERAVFGAICAIWSQLYSDILYTVFRFGGESRRTAVISRSPSDWAVVYVTKIVYAVVLFGVYEASQIPATALVNTLMSGGSDACSQNIPLCLEAIVTGQAIPMATPEAQFRALVTTAVSYYKNNHNDNHFLQIFC